MSSIIAITIIGWFTLGFYVQSRMLPATKSPDHLDWEFQPLSNFDVVISLYDESLQLTRDTFAAIASIPSIRSLDPRLIIYTKHPSADPEEIRAVTNATDVIHLPNVGREAQTYLQYILDRWDNLPCQVLFTQAEMHFLDDALARLKFFHSNDTGMMSLAESGWTCSCEHCNDEQWTEGNHTIARTYMAVNDGERCDRVLESYRGQFIVSGRRIRGISKSIYEQLNNELVDEQSWAHREPFTKVRASWSRSEDSMSAPLFGYTLEKFWNVLFQCSNPRVAWACPSVDSGITRWTSKEDCQCLDHR